MVKKMYSIRANRIFILLLFCGIFSFGGIHLGITEAKEKKPDIIFELTKDDKRGEQNLAIKVTDHSGLKSVQYAVGKHRRPFFRYSHYVKNVKNLEITSATSLSFSIKVKTGDVYTFYAENKKGKINHSIIKIGQATKEEKKEEKKETLPSVKTEEGAKTSEDVNKNNPDIEGKAETKKEALQVDERRAVWVSFLEYKKEGYTKKNFTKRAKEILDDIKAKKMNTLYMHVRPFSDAMYQSSYYPWSVYASGKEGRNPGFDPLQIMIKEAHDRGIKLHAYINPYRVNYATIFEKLETDPEDYKWFNPAYRWLNDEDEKNDRNVLKHDKMYYYNPSKPEVVDLISNGVKEICENYDVDGVIFDDYFYPNLGLNYEKNFDSKEYKDYVKNFSKKGKKPLSIIKWRKENISSMIKSVYSAVKGVGKGQEFGISPTGNISNLRSGYSYYLDIDRICREDGFVDYIEPQLYWGFKNKSVPYALNVARWKKLVTNPNTKIYIALPIYRIVDKPEKEWEENQFFLSDMLENLREQRVPGFSIFRYDFMTDRFLRTKENKEARDHFIKLLN